MIQGITISKLFTLMIAICLSLVFINASNKKNKKKYMILSLVPIIAFFIFTEYEQEQKDLSDEVEWITDSIRKEYKLNQIEVEKVNEGNKKKRFTLQTENGNYVLEIEKGRLTVIDTKDGENLRGRKNVLDVLSASEVSNESLFYESDTSYGVESDGTSLKIKLLNHVVTTIRENKEDGEIIYLDKDKQTEKHE